MLQLQLKYKCLPQYLLQMVYYLLNRIKQIWLLPAAAMNKHTPHKKGIRRDVWFSQGFYLEQIVIMILFYHLPLNTLRYNPPVAFKRYSKSLSIFYFVIVFDICDII